MVGGKTPTRRRHLAKLNFLHQHPVTRQTRLEFLLTLCCQMSRVAQINGATAANTMGEPGELHARFQSLQLMSPDDDCPVCHSKRYLRRDMRFMINPVCYHKMCENCVERIFSSGIRPCPYAHCGKPLRRNQFRLPTFEDLQLEREIDIRREVAQV